MHLINSFFNQYIAMGLMPLSFKWCGLVRYIYAYMAMNADKIYPMSG